MKAVLRQWVVLGVELKRLRDDSEGVTAMEYGLLAATTCVAILATVQNLSAPIKTFFQSLLIALGLAYP